MAEESSFLGVIERIRAEGQLDRNTGSNSIKSVKETFKKELTREGQLTRNTGANSFKSLKDSILGNDLAKEEKDREQTDLLKSIAAGTNKPSKEMEKSEEKKSGRFFADLAILFAPIGATLGKISPIFTKVGSLFSKSGPLFKIFGKGGSLGKFLPALGRVFAKVALPLTIAFGVFKGIVEGIKGYKEGGIMGAIEGFFIGAFDSVFGELAKLIGNIGEKIFSLLGFDLFGEKFNEALGNIISGVKGVITGIFDSIKALFGGDTEAFKEALSGILGSIKTMIVGEDGEGGIIGMMIGLIHEVFTTIPEKIGKFFDNILVPFLTETVPTFLSETLFPKLLEVGQNIGKVIKDVFMGMLDAIGNLIPEPLKKAGGFIKNLFSRDKDDDQTVTAIKESSEERLDRVSQESSESFDEALERNSESFDAALERPTNNSGAQMEVGMSNIADSRAKPATVVVTGGGGGGGSGQGTTVNSSNITYNGNQHADESTQLTQPSYGYALA